MDKVSIVDDDPEHLNIPDNGLQKYIRRCDYVTAADRETALKVQIENGIFKSKMTHIIVTDRHWCYGRI